MVIVAALQLPGRGGDLAERGRVASDAVAAAVSRGASIVVLPEAYFPGYAHGPGDGARAAQEFAGSHSVRHGVTVVTGFLARRGARTECGLGAASADGGWRVYRKRFPSPAESRVWSAGREPVVVATPGGRVGLLLCADVLQAASWRPFAGRVDLIVVSAAWPDYRGRSARRGTERGLGWVFRESGPHRDRLLARAARVLGVPVVFANACGPYQGEERFSGGSAIWGPDGRCLCRAGEGSEVVTSAVGWGEARGGRARGVAPGRWALHRDPRWVAFAELWRAAVLLSR